LGGELMVKSYLELNESERIIAREFIRKSFGFEKISEEELDKEIMDKSNNLGEGALFLLKNNEVTGFINIILEVVKKNGIVYINNVRFSKVKDVNILLNKSMEFLDKSYKPKEIYLGIRDEKSIKFVQEAGYKIEYSSFKMELEDKSLKIDILEKEVLSKEKLEEYVDLYNESFSDMPHGSYITLEESEKFYREMNYKNQAYIIKDGEIPIGFLEIDIKEDVRGFFDIGLKREFRGRGYGKRILEIAIQTLAEKGVKNISLVVIGRNKIAFEMYKKRGFKIYEKFSDWTILRN
jgi:ribosomal protein S18 acetylase RimI-like enzyme